jgi:hypothetical protein
MTVEGMAPWKAAKLQIQGINESRRYQKMYNERQRLSVLTHQNATPTEKAKLERRIAKLDSQMTLSPVHTMIQNGLLGNVVEDVSMDVDEFSFKSRYTDKAREKMNWVPEPLANTAKFLYMTKDSSSYRFMNDMVKYSDFGARYALVNHRLGKGETESKALTDAMRVFVNYDLPTHKAIQYGNDMGFIWFSKYYLRIQHVIFDFFRDKPANALVWALFQQNVMNVPDITQSNFLSNSPLNMFGGFDRMASGVGLHPLAKAM